MNTGLRRLVGRLLFAVLVSILVVSPIVQGANDGLIFSYLTVGDLGDPFGATILRGWNAAIEAFGATTTVGSTSGDYAKLIDLVDAAIAVGVDGIFVFSWYDPTGLTPSIQRAIEEGVQFVVMSTRDPVFSPAEVPFVGFDFVDQGYTVGRYLARQLEAEGLVSDVNIEFVGEVADSPVGTTRRQGILNALDDAGIGYAASEIFEIGLDMTKMVDIIKARLLAYPETDVIVGLGSGATATAAIALQDLGYEPGKVKWTGFDLLPETLEGIRAGYGAVNVDEAFNYGFLAATTLYLRAQYGFVVGDLPIATVMVDQANVEEFAD